MSILTKPLPEAIEIAGQEYPVRTDFRVWLRFEEILNRNESLEKRLIDLILLCMPEDKIKRLPSTMEELFDGLCRFYVTDLSKENEQKAKKNNTRGVMSFSFEHDAGYIYAAFLAQYGIDLIDIPYLHWWKFQALFRGLEEKSRLMQIIGYRNIDLSEIEDKKRRKMYAELKYAYALPDTRSQEEKDEAFARSLLNAF